MLLDCERGPDILVWFEAFGSIVGVSTAIGSELAHNGISSSTLRRERLEPERFEPVRFETERLEPERLEPTGFRLTSVPAGNGVVSVSRYRDAVV